MFILLLAVWKKALFSCVSDLFPSFAYNNCVELAEFPLHDFQS